MGTGSFGSRIGLSLTLVVAALAIVGGSPQPTATPPSPPGDLMLSSETHELLARAVDKSTIDNVSVFLGNSKGELFAYSKGSSAPAADTPTVVASSSKWVSGLMLTYLIQEGNLTLDSRPSDYLDYWSPNGTKGEVTLEYLMSFTSGFMSLSNSTCIFSSDYPGVSACAKQIYESYPEPLEFFPGTTFGYSNEHLEIAAAMAEAATGKAWAQLYIELVKEPLALQDESGYNAIGGVSGSLNISTRDYITVLTGRVMTPYSQAAPGNLSPRTVALMNTDHTVPQAVAINWNATFNVTVDSSWPAWHYGYANWIECPADSPEYSQECTANALQGVHSCIGAYGFYPIVDYRPRQGLLGSDALYIVVAPEPSVAAFAETPLPMVKALDTANAIRAILNEALPLVASSMSGSGDRRAMRMGRRFLRHQ